MQDILPEDLSLGSFPRAKRAERSNRRFLLLLLEVGDNAESVGIGDREGLIKAANEARRETDPAGWYEQDSTLGIIFTAGTSG